MKNDVYQLQVVDNVINFFEFNETFEYIPLFSEFIVLFTVIDGVESQLSATKSLQLIKALEKGYNYFLNHFITVENRIWLNLFYDKIVTFIQKCENSQELFEVAQFTKIEIHGE